MLYQPSDLPRPMRLQGVFVSDAEIGKVTQHWRDQIGDPHYDLSIVDSGDESQGSVEDTPDEDADRLLQDAVAVVREYDRASASLLQRRLRIGYARAARIIDQLEARGYVGAFDGSNARVVLRRDDGPADMDDWDEDSEHLALISRAVTPPGPASEYGKPASRAEIAAARERQRQIERFGSAAGRRAGRTLARGCLISAMGLGSLAVVVLMRLATR